MTGKMLTNKSRIMARDFSKIKDESTRLPKELVLLRDVARSSEDSQKFLAKEVERLHPFAEEASLRNKFDALSCRLKVVDLEWVGLVKEFFPLFVKKLMASDHFNLAMADLSKKP
ncbi:hypothetical protein Tco_0509068 [Tanacetum coccineum]